MVNTKNITDSLEALVSINSASGNEGATKSTLVAMLEKAGFEVELQDVGSGRSNIFAQKNSAEGETAVLFYGHQDTVAITNDWKHDPLTLTYDNDKIFGLGAYDMKGGIAATLEATRDTKAYVKVFLAVDEENISEGAWHAVANNKEFFEDVRLAISAEPSLLGGVSSVTVGRTGRFLYDVNFMGKSAHLANYKEGIDAIELQSQFLTAFYKNRAALFDDHGSTAQIRSISSTVVGMSVPQSASCQVEVLSSDAQSAEVVAELLQGLSAAAKVALSPRITPYLPGYYNPDFPHKNLLEQTIQTIFNKPTEYITRRSVGDDNVLASLGIAVVTWGPEGGNAHTADEWVSVSSLEMLSSAYEQFLIMVTTKK